MDDLDFLFPAAECWLGTNVNPWGIATRRILT